MTGQRGTFLDRTLVESTAHDESEAVLRCAVCEVPVWTSGGYPITLAELVTLAAGHVCQPKAGA